MKNILGIIVEYNPFHYGHLYHLQQSKNKSAADIVIAVMSGSFLQRGEPACASKWARTEMALASGVDLVIELPYIFATQKAEVFATASVALLKEIGANQLCFGSEGGELHSFHELIDIMLNKEEKINESVRKHLKKGVSYPRAFAEAFQENISSPHILDLSKPNNILGYHYIKAIKELNASIEPYTIKREKSNYHDEFFLHDEKIASATAIRSKLLETGFNVDTIKHYVPSITKQILQSEINQYGSIPHWEDYFPFLQHRIITASLDELRKIYECEEGLEYRLKKFITRASSYEHFMEAVKTKRYTRTRLQRLFVQILMNTTKEFMKEYCQPATPPYIRILGMSAKGRKYLSTVKKKIQIPLVTRASEYSHPVLEKDILASQVYQLPFAKKEVLHKEYEAIPIIVDR